MICYVKRGEEALTCPCKPYPFGSKFPSIALSSGACQERMLECHSKQEFGLKSEDLPRCVPCTIFQPTVHVNRSDWTLTGLQKLYGLGIHDAQEVEKRKKKRCERSTRLGGRKRGIFFICWTSGRTTNLNKRSITMMCAFIVNKLRMEPYQLGFVNLDEYCNTIEA